MASEASTTDQGVGEHFEEKKVSNDAKLEDEVNLRSKENAGRDEVDNAKGEGFTVTATAAHVLEEKPEREVVSVIDAKKEDGLVKNEETENSVLESKPFHPLASTSEINEGETQNKNDDSVHQTHSEVQENIKDTEVTSTSVNIPQEVPVSSSGLDILRDENVEGEAKEKTIPASSKDSGDELEEPVPSESTLVRSVSEAPEKVEGDKHDSSGEVEHDVSEAIKKVDGDQNVPAMIEVPLKDLEVVSGSPEEEKQKKIIQIQEPSSNLTLLDVGAEALIDPSLHEGKASGDAEVLGKKEVLEREITQASVETTATPFDPYWNEGKASGGAEVVGKKEEILEKEVTETPVVAQTQEGLKAKTESIQGPFADDKLSGGVMLEKSAEEVEDGLEASTNISPVVADLSTELGKASELGEIIEEKKDNTIESTSIDAALSGGAASEGDMVVEKKTDDGIEALKAGLVATCTELTYVGVSSEQVNAPETFKVVEEEKDRSTKIIGEQKNLEVISKDSNLYPETSDVTLVGHQVLYFEKIGTSLEAPKVQTTVNEPSEQVIEKETVISEKEGSAKSSRGLSLAEAFAEEVKYIEASETLVEKKSGTSRELDEEEKPSIEEVNDIGPSQVAEERKDETPREQAVEEKASTEEIKYIEASGTVVKVMDETSKELTTEESNSTIVEHKKKEAKIGGSTETAPGKQEHEELSNRKEVRKEAKDEDPIASSDAVDFKLVKEVPKRESSNIFSKVKRSIVKAKKAILGKSSSSKALSSEANVNS